MIRQDDFDKSRKNASGFTMLELMIIVVILGILAAIAVPTFGDYIPKMEARSQARATLNYLRLARSRAISESTQYGVYVDTNNRTYILFKDTVNPAMTTYHDGDSVVVGPETIDPDVTITQSTFSNNAVVFMPTGGASQSGTITFDKVGGGAAYTVSVLGSTGRSKLQ
jgi:prepilin-type N-terminal cleavage/methylation domain-containing protein